MNRTGYLKGQDHIFMYRVAMEIDRIQNLPILTEALWTSKPFRNSDVL